MARSGHGEERLTASAMGHQRRACLCGKPITTDHSRCCLHTPSLPSALGMPEKSLQKTKAGRNEAFPPRLLRNESGSVSIFGSVEPRSSFDQCCPSTSLVPLVSGHQRDPPQKAAGSGWTTGWATDTASQSVTGTHSLCGPLCALLPWDPHVLGLGPLQKAMLLFRRSPLT